MKSVALIACSNGLGHTRRIILLAKSLIRQEVNVTVFAPLDAVKKLNHRDSLKSINFIDFLLFVVTVFFLNNFYYFLLIIISDNSSKASWISFIKSN